jgi:hypothetical protein
MSDVRVDLEVPVLGQAVDDGLRNLIRHLHRIANNFVVFLLSKRTTKQVMLLLVFPNHWFTTSPRRESSNTALNASES